MIDGESGVELTSLEAIDSDDARQIIKLRDPRVRPLPGIATEETTMTEQTGNSRPPLVKPGTGDDRPDCRAVGPVRHAVTRRMRPASTLISQPDPCRLESAPALPARPILRQSRVSG